LEAEDVRSIVMGVVSSQVQKLVDLHTESSRPDEWDLDGLYNGVASMFGPELQHAPEELEGENRETLRERIMEWAEELYQAKEQTYSPGLMQFAARGTLLRIMDGLWMEHLTAMDDMIAGIGLRAYGQRDPLTEYKQEAYRSFQGLLENIQLNLANAIFRIQFYAEPASPAAQAGAPVRPPDGQAVELPAGDGQPAVTAANGSSLPTGDGAERVLNPALARRAAQLVQPPAPMRNMHTNIQEEALAPGPGARRPSVADGRPMSRHERKRQEAEERKQRHRDLKRQRNRGT
jgi:hypothetical protein